MSAALDRAFSALADPSRRKVIELLRKTPRRAGEIGDALRLSPPAMSRHLRVLRKSGLVLEEMDEGDARVRVYRLRREPFTRLSEWLKEVDAFWGDQLASFKEHLDRR
jgi:DNA-binding transcriptional ArsR family regulator